MKQELLTGLCSWMLCFGLGLFWKDDEFLFLISQEDQQTSLGAGNGEMGGAPAVARL